MQGIKTPRSVLQAGLVACLLAATPVLAEGETRWVYHWTDARGVDHFSDLAVEGSKKIRIPARVPRNASAKEAGLAALLEEPSAASDTDCEQKRAALKEYSSPDFQIIETDALGKEHVYGESERAALIENTQDEIDALCD